MTGTTISPTGTPASCSCRMASNRRLGAGAPGSMRAAAASSAKVMLKSTLA
jgi:hypothetical protein